MHLGGAFESVARFCQAIDAYIEWYNTERIRLLFKPDNHTISDSGPCTFTHLDLTSGTSSYVL
ncbi:IS3 family transposase [Corynebacterium hadale]|uniref:IS3 family transposase n=1 Tax=Corynebacterium hadale TaxID=2026255 RepID=UPI003B968E88